MFKKTISTYNIFFFFNKLLAIHYYLILQIYQDNKINIELFIIINKKAKY